MRKLLITGLIIGGLMASGYVIWHQWRTRFYTGVLPAQIKVDGVHSMRVQEGVREGCGAVVFDMSDDLAKALMDDAPNALAHAIQARAYPNHRAHAYGPWAPTPYREHNPDGTALEDRWLSGLSCAALPDDLAQAIQGALDSPGAYVATSAEGGIIVIPARKLVVLAFMG
jgi:hypothetical protein